MAGENRPGKNARQGRHVVGFVPVFLLLGIFGVSAVMAVVPGLGSETDRFRAAVYDSDRTIYTTYFYWYKGTDTIQFSHQILYDLDSNAISTIMANLASPPAGWPGPTNATINQIISFNATGDGHNYTEAISHHPLAAQPTYNERGDVISTLDTSLPKFTTDANGILTNMSSWIDWKNPDWHEWELRCMMRAGIDVAMPVYWWTGLPSNMSGWAREGLLVLNDTVTALQARLIDEHTAGSAYTPEDVPKIAMFYDTSLMKGLWAWNMSMTTYGNANHMNEFTDGADLTDPYWANQFYLRIQEFYDVIINGSACHTVTITYNGIPEEYCVVWLYSGSFFGNIGPSVLDYSKGQFESRYGKKLLFVGGGEWGEANVDGECGWGACCGLRTAKGTRIPAGGYGPGYYNVGTLICQEAAYTPRDVNRYKHGLMSVIDSGAVWIHVETWNELLEGTDICWTQENGYDHIDATREIADIFHAMRGLPPLEERVNLWLVITPLSCLIALAGIALVLQKRRPTETAIPPRSR
nr:hypothetical protein [Candidatus Sigynarchaeum springense]